MRRIVCLSLLAILTVAAAALCAEGPTKIDLTTVDASKYRLILNRLMPEATACYNEALKKSSNLAGKMKIKVTIKPSGEAEAVEVLEDTMQNKEVEGCIGELFKKEKWPAAETAIYFEYRFSFSPTKK